MPRSSRCARRVLAGAGGDGRRAKTVGGSVDCWECACSSPLDRCWSTRYTTHAPFAGGWWRWPPTCPAPAALGSSWTAPSSLASAARGSWTVPQTLMATYHRCGGRRRGPRTGVRARRHSGPHAQGPGPSALVPAWRQVAEVSRRILALKQLLGGKDDVDIVFMVVREPRLLTTDLGRWALPDSPR